MADIFLSEAAKEELRRFSPDDQQEVVRAISFLEDEEFREQNKMDLCLREDEFDIWALVVGTIWLGFCTSPNGSIRVVWLSLRSRFRPF